MGSFTSAASAQTAGMQSFQGRLKQNGIPVNGNVTLEFRIFDAATAGNQVDVTGDGQVTVADTFTVSNVPATNGLISTKFGPLKPSGFNGDQRWLEVTITSPPPVTVLPRLEMATAPASAEQVNIPGTGTGAILIAGNGNVGIGTATSPSSPRLSVVDNSGTKEVVAQFTGSGKTGVDSNAYLGLKHSSASSGWNLRAGPAGDFAIHQAGFGDRVFVNGTNGNIGIGTNSSLFGTLTVASDAGNNDLVTFPQLQLHTVTDPAKKLSLGYSSTFNYASIQAYDDNAGPTSLVLNTVGGNVGIGKTSPTAKLHIGGTPGVDGIRFPDGTLQKTAPKVPFVDNLVSPHSATQTYTTVFVDVNDSSKDVILPNDGTAVIIWTFSASLGTSALAEVRPVIGTVVAPQPVVFGGTNANTISGSWKTSVSAGQITVKLQARKATSTSITSDTSDTVSWTLMVFPN